MKNLNLFIAGLIVIILFLVYQVIDLKQEVNSISNGQNPQISIPNGFTIYGRILAIPGR
jgi:hypothetical protein